MSVRVCLCVYVSVCVSMCLCVCVEAIVGISVCGSVSVPTYSKFQTISNEMTEKLQRLYRIKIRLMFSSPTAAVFSCLGFCLIRAYTYPGLAVIPC